MKWVLIGILAVPTSLCAQTDTTATVTFGGFVDTYYAHQFQRPATGDIPFLTQPARNREFNINLAFVDARLTSAHVRGRLAIQAGTSVQANYAGEPRIGRVSGSELSRHIQEAVAGVRVTDNVWIDAGIYLSHIGSEGWISRDNWTYTRSLVSEYSPYYESGVKATWMPTRRLTASANVVNGWQNISETNAKKAVGIRLDYALSPGVSLTYSNFIGNEMADSIESKVRVFHDASARVMLTDRFGLLATGDYGTQDGSHWFGYSIIGRMTLSPTMIVSARAEQYRDENRVIVDTGTSRGLDATAFSAGLDYTPVSRVIWRTELRTIQAGDAVFPRDGSSQARTMTFAVTSLAVTF